MTQDVKITDLEPIVAPDAVSFWPPQPGWYVVIVLLLALIGYAIYKIKQNQLRNAYRKTALLELEKLNSQSFSVILLSQLNGLLKATALKGYTRNEVAGLNGSKWLKFLESKDPNTKFTVAPGTYLEVASYQAPEKIEVSTDEWHELISMSEKWIKGHKQKNK